MGSRRRERATRQRRIGERLALRPRKLVIEALPLRLMFTQTTGLFLNDPGSQPGYVLFSPNTTTTTYLMDKGGNVVNTWNSAYQPGLLSYLLPNGNLLARRLTAWPGGQRLDQRGRRRRAVGRVRLEWQPDLVICLRQPDVSGAS